MPAPRYASPRPAPEPILRLPEVLARTGLGRSALYSAIAAGTFPAPLQLGPRSVGWKESWVRDWQDSRPVAFLKPVHRRQKKESPGPGSDRIGADEKSLNAVRESESAAPR